VHTPDSQHEVRALKTLVSPRACSPVVQAGAHVGVVSVGQTGCTCGLSHQCADTAVMSDHARMVLFFDTPPPPPLALPRAGTLQQQTSSSARRAASC
jgi:hypothetical protein